MHVLSVKVQTFVNNDFLKLFFYFSNAVCATCMKSTFCKVQIA